MLAESITLYFKRSILNELHSGFILITCFWHEEDFMFVKGG